VSFIDNVITNNSRDVRLLSIRSDFIFTGNTVTGNEGFGLIYQGGYSSGSNMTDSIVIEDNIIEDNIIDDNSSYGIYLQAIGDADPSIQRNNSGSGIYVFAGSNNIQPLIIVKLLVMVLVSDLATQACMFQVKPYPQLPVIRLITMVRVFMFNMMLTVMATLS
jgi:hypothetical protein